MGQGPTANLEGEPSVLACGYAAAPGRLRRSGRTAYAPQHLADAPSVAVTAVVGEPVRVLGPRGEAVVVCEGPRLSETPVLPAALVGRALGVNLHHPSGFFSDHPRPPRT